MKFETKPNANSCYLDHNGKIVRQFETIQVRLNKNFPQFNWNGGLRTVKGNPHFYTEKKCLYFRDSINRPKQFQANWINENVLGICHEDYFRCQKRLGLLFTNKCSIEWIFVKSFGYGQVDGIFGIVDLYKQNHLLKINKDDIKLGYWNCLRLYFNNEEILLPNWNGGNLIEQVCMNEKYIGIIRERSVILMNLKCEVLWEMDYSKTNTIPLIARFSSDGTMLEWHVQNGVYSIDLD